MQGKISHNKGDEALKQFLQSVESLEQEIFKKVNQTKIS